MAFDFDWFASPIFGDGDYPTEMKSTINLVSKRLPSFSEEEKKLIKGIAYDINWGMRSNPLIAFWITSDCFENLIVGLPSFYVSGSSHDLKIPSDFGY